MHGGGRIIRAAHVPARGESVFLTPERSRGDGIEAGRLLFNSGRFFEAHEEWESEWLAASGSRRLLLQGLIQVAAAFYKATRRERAAGCVQLLSEGLSRLDRFADGEEGLALEEFRRRVEKALERARVWTEGGPPLDSGSLPRLGVSRLKD